MYIKLILFVTILTTQKKGDVSNLERINKILSSSELDENLLNLILQGGEIKGYYSAYEFYELINNLNSKYPQFVTETISIGVSHMNREIRAFKIGRLGCLKSR